MAPTPKRPTLCIHYSIPIDTAARRGVLIGEGFRPSLSTDHTPSPFSPTSYPHVRGQGRQSARQPVEIFQMTSRPGDISSSGVGPVEPGIAGGSYIAAGRGADRHYPQLFGPADQTSAARGAVCAIQICFITRPGRFVIHWRGVHILGRDLFATRRKKAYALSHNMGSLLAGPRPVKGFRGPIHNNVLLSWTFGPVCWWSR